MSDSLEPLDRDAAAELSKLGPISEVPGAARQRIWNAVDARIAMTPSGGATPAASALPPRNWPVSWVARHPAIALTGALVLGGAVGALGRGRPEVRVVTVEHVPAANSGKVPTPAPVDVEWTEVASPEPAASAVASPPRSAASTQQSTGQQLAAESAILDVARTAIGHGEADHAIAAVDRHAKAFPHGMLREEREALGVKALVLAGRGADARARAARFRASYPESLFLPALESSLRSIP
jgi:hypothetical protein